MIENEKKQEFLEDQLIILTKSIIDKFLKEKNPADLISLYTFYYYTAKWQKTNQPHCTDGYVQKGLHWGYDKFIKTKKILLNLGLIEQVVNKTSKGTIEGYYIKIKFIIKQSASTLQNPGLDTTSTGKQSTNALSTNNENALSTNNENKLLSKDNNKLSEDKDISLKNHVKQSIKSNNLTNTIIDLFLESNNKAFKEKNYKETNIKFTNTYIKKYLKEFKTEQEFIDSFKNSLQAFKQNIKGLPDTTSYWFKLPYNSPIQSNYEHHRNKTYTPTRKLKDKYPEITKQFSNLIGKPIDFDLLTFMNCLVKENKKIRTNTIQGYTRDQITPDDFHYYDYNTYVRNPEHFILQFYNWLEEQFESETFKFEYHYFKSYMKNFAKWFEEVHDGVDLYPDEDLMQAKLDKFLRNQ